MKRIMALVMVLTMILSTTAMAETTNTTFKDVPTSHWAYEAIELMAGKGIINGDGGYFRPNDTVSRAEFAKMLVLTLDLDLNSPSTASFTDVLKSDWEYKYVETAKNYLTGFTSGNGYKFKPDDASVREDMAVAVVKGLFAKGEVDDPDSTNLGILNSYSDQGSISTNLRKYVAAAINEGIMVGSGGVFSPMGNLTRAEAATLLARLIDEEQKVVFEDGDKVVVGDEDDTSEPVVSTGDKTPVLEKVIRDTDIVLEWSEVPSEGFEYYKVVISEEDSTPSYPDSGYAYCLEGTSSTRAELYAGMDYQDGDMYSIKAGKAYYVAITAVYNDGKYTSNVKRVTMPGSYTEVSESDKTPSLSYTLKDSGVKLDWTSTPSTGFSYYKVVLSQTKENPYYPDYGYATYISDASNSDYFLQKGQSYNDGSKGGIGGEVEDEGYYVTITAVYSSGKYTSNSVYVTVPDK